MFADVGARQTGRMSIARTGYGIVFSLAVSAIASPALADVDAAHDERPGAAAKAGGSSAAGISFGEKPVWSLIGGSNVSSIDVTQPTVSIGIERVSPKIELRVTLRKNVATTSVSAATGGIAGERAFGHALLMPSLANLGGSIRGFVRLRSTTYYDSKTSFADWQKVAGNEKRDFDEFCNGQSTTSSADCYTRDTHYIYFDVDTAEAQFAVTGGVRALPATFVLPTKISAGYAFKSEGVLPQTFAGSSNVHLMPYGGITGRFVGSDMSEAARRIALGNASFAYYGLEAGLELQLSNVLINSEVTAIAPGATWEHRAPGISGLQFALTGTFILPWTVLGSPPQTSNTSANDKRTNNGGGQDNGATAKPAAGS